jgi:ATP-dependent DNA ligase
MADVLILKAVEYDKCSAKFKKTYPNVEFLPTDGWLLQRKYDGCFGMAVLREDGGSQMLSRTGEDWSASCGRILSELAEALTEHRGQGWHSAVILGEVWHQTWSFPVISGKFRKRAPCPELLFAANDVLPEGLATPFEYRARYADLLSMLGNVPAGDPAFRVFCVPLEDKGPGTVFDLALKWQGEGGYDGAILRDPRAPYTIGLARQGQIVKVKPSLSLDLRVIGVLPGEGKHEGRAGALRCDLGDGKFVDVGTGMSDADREEFWQCRDGMLAPHVTVVEVEAMGWSTEGKLREPRFKGIRHDKETPDR